MLWYGTPFGYFRGQLPMNCNLEVVDVLFDEAAAILDVMQFDVGLIAATTFTNESELSATGVSPSAWCRVRDPDVSTATVDVNATAVYCVAKRAVAAAGRGDVVVIGLITGIGKIASAAHVLGQPFTVSMAAGTPNVLAPLAAVPTTLVATANLRKLVAIATNAVTAATANVQFNGFGWGLCVKNVAYAAD